MPVITDKNKAKQIIDSVAKKKASMAIFCTASHWNTEAILIAADNIAKKYNIKNIPVSIAMTFTYRHMPQSCRVTRSGDPVTGFISIMEYIKTLCDREDSPYKNVVVLPHLDHADPVKDRWALTEGLQYLASVMFDAQKYSFEENVRMTRDYVEKYGDKVCVEGVMEKLNVNNAAGSNRFKNYIERALEYVKSTGVDFLVADLGTEQQSSKVGGSKYLKDRAVNLSSSLGKHMLVLHGTSCLDESQIKGLASDGVIRVNMWTRIVREAGQAAAESIVKRIDKIRKGDFQAAESMQYIYDNIDNAVEIMEHMMILFGYPNLAASDI